MPVFTLLHLTDLHLGSRLQRPLWSTFKNGFLDDLERLLEQSGPIHLVAFTGDIVQSGANDEFSQATDFIGQVWDLFKRTSGSSPKLAMVPGNHDLSRPNSKSSFAKSMRQWHVDRDIRDSFWGDGSSEYRQGVLQAFAEFTQWKNSLSVIPDEWKSNSLVPGDFIGRIELDGASVGLVGLNSSFLQLTDVDFEKWLDLDNQQLFALESDIDTWTRRNTINLLLTHHPPSWLSTESYERFRAEIAPPERFVAHLCGHLHEAHSTTVSEGGASARRTWQGRSLFGLEQYHRNGQYERRLHGYSVRSFHIEGQHSYIRHWPREGRKSQAGHWRMVVDNTYDKLIGDYESENFTPAKKALHRPSRVDDQKEAVVSEGATEGSTLERSNRVLSVEISDSAHSRDNSGRLSGVPTWVPAASPSHDAIRESERVEFRKHLDADRAVWLLTDWGMASEGFLASIFRSSSVTRKIYRVNFENAENSDDFLAEFVNQLGLSFSDLGNALALVGASVLVLDNISILPSSGTAESSSVNEMVNALLDYAPDTQVVMIARTAPADHRFKTVQLKPLEEFEMADYIRNHRDGGEAQSQAQVVERLHRLSDGVPNHIDRLLRELQIMSLDELESEESDALLGADEGTGSDVPRSLIRAVSSVSNANEKYGKRSFRLLKILAVLQHGETLPNIKYFDSTEPLWPRNVEELRSLGLLETVPISVHARVAPSAIAGGNASDGLPSKLLVVPRQVRDYVRTLLSDSDMRNIFLLSMDHYFGPAWKDGSYERPPILKARAPSQASRSSNNELSTVRWMLKDAYRSRDLSLAARVLAVANYIFNELESQKRYRELVVSARDIVFVLETEGVGEDSYDVYYHYGEGLRMLGQTAESVEKIEKALSIAPERTTNKWRSHAHLALALAYETLSDNSKIRFHAKKTMEYAEKENAEWNQASSILLTLDLDDGVAGARSKLQQLEDDLRNRGFDIVSNNIALELARRAKSSSEKKRYHERVLREGKGTDFFNRYKAIVFRGEELISENKIGGLSPADRHLLYEAYDYLFSQRMTGMFDRCTRVLWHMSASQRQVPMLLRLFRHSSFIWRIYGKNTLEESYIKELNEMFPVSNPGPNQGQDREVEYYLLRVRSRHDT
jgi:predicted MPP superfamily phosphohydrolase/tetratricopeptide (TPR) repeat protein